MHTCTDADIKAKQQKDEDKSMWAQREHPLVRNKTDRDAALACGVALESANHELLDATKYADKIDSAPVKGAIADALLAVLRARELLAMAIRRLPE